MMVFLLNWMPLYPAYACLSCGGESRRNAELIYQPTSTSTSTSTSTPYQKPIYVFTADLPVA